MNLNDLIRKAGVQAKVLGGSVFPGSPPGSGKMGGNAQDGLDGIVDRISRLAGRPAPDLIPRVFVMKDEPTFLDGVSASRRGGHHVVRGAAGSVGPHAAIAADFYSHHGQLTDLEQIARLQMAENGLVPDFSSEALSELATIKAPAADPGVKDLRSLKWISIDNDDTKDLDQISVAEKLPNGDIKVLVGIADVDALVPKGSALDEQASKNTATVYTPAKNFSMIPEKLSTGFTSMNPDVDRLAMVTEMVIAPDGSIRSSNIYQAMVNNHAQLAYNSVAAWLDGKDPGGRDPLLAPLKRDGIAEQVRLQDEAARRLKARREKNGALDFDVQRGEPVMENGKVVGLKAEERNRANDLIEDLMVASNGVAARFLKAHNFPVVQRVLPPPSTEYWWDMRSLAKSHGGHLPDAPDSVALSKFLKEQRAKDPKHFPELSLSMLRLMGRASYQVERPGQPSVGHFGLAVVDYTHSTAPNRRYPDLITQRLLKAAMNGKPCPYSADELAALALHCSTQERAVDQVDRHLAKSAAALYLLPKVGQRFHAVVNSTGSHGVFVRLTGLPVEGRLDHAPHDLRVGRDLTVKLDSVDVEKGYIDFVVSHGRGRAAA